MDKQFAPHLRAVSLFAGMTPDALALLVQACSLHQFAKDTQVLTEQERTSDVFVVLEGAVRVSSYSESGREITYSDIAAGSLFGELSAIDRLPRSASVIALSDCKLARLPAERFAALLRSDAEIAFRLVELLVGKVRTMSERVFEVSALALRERLRKELLRLAAKEPPASGPGVTIKPAPTHYEIAARIGSHREAVTRELSRLEQAKLLEIRRQEIHILDIERLRDFEE
jgi:CRP/FNR family cyclic AMP-dependent transcriptional regulator